MKWSYFRAENTIRAAALITVFCPSDDTEDQPESCCHKPVVSRPLTRSWLQDMPWNWPLDGADLSYSGETTWNCFSNVCPHWNIESKYITRSRTVLTGKTSFDPIVSETDRIWCCWQTDEHHSTSVFAVFKCNRFDGIHRATSRRTQSYDPVAKIYYKSILAKLVWNYRKWRVSLAILAYKITVFMVVMYRMKNVGQRIYSFRVPCRSWNTCAYYKNLWSWPTSWSKR